MKKINSTLGDSTRGEAEGRGRQLLEKRLLTVTQLAFELAAALRYATAAEGDADYDVSRTWSDRQDDHDFAHIALRKINPTLRALNRKSEIQNPK